MSVEKEFNEGRAETERGAETVRRAAKRRGRAPGIIFACRQEDLGTSFRRGGPLHPLSAGGHLRPPFEGLEIRRPLRLLHS